MKYLIVIYSLSLLIACSGSNTGSGDNNDPAEKWSIPADQVIDAGPGKNGIPALNFPNFIPVSSANINPSQIVLGINYKGSIKAYPHNILDWHEVLNDRVDDDVLIVNYCPLTGSGMLWESNSSIDNPTWGVSGLLYNSNLILFDRDTDSNWSQMLEESIQGNRSGEVPVKLKMIETSWETWKQMYPDSLVLSEETGFDRDYSDYPYRGFRSNEHLLFPVANIDNRLHPKKRVLGIRAEGNISKVFPIDNFTADLQVINTDFNGQAIIVIGSSETNIAAVYSATTDDNITQNFTGIQDQLPVVMSDDEGNTWDIFGRAVSGDREGQELAKTNSFIAYWYAWAAFYPDAEIYF